MLYCDLNQITNLYISKNTRLFTLHCESNQLTTLNISKNTALTDLICSSNQLTSLDISNQKVLKYLGCSSNQLTTLDVSKNTALWSLSCDSNQLTALDIRANTELEALYCFSNQLTSLDVNNQTKLKYLDCSYNQLTSLDVSKNEALWNFYCNSNQLSYLNVKNGNNSNFNTLSFLSNPNLTCILVDNIVYSNANWVAQKDAKAKFHIDCNELTLPTNNFTIESKGESCLGENNGELSITATAAYAYKAYINGQTYPFANNSLKLPKLIPGIYTISIIIPDQIFEQNFTVIIPKGASITGKSSVAANKVSVEITEGTAPYTVFVDGVKQFETTDSNFTIDTKKGGLLQVKTAKACEGIYAQNITGLGSSVSAYPNPTSGSFEIELPTLRKDVVIALYTLDGQLISNKTYTIENGKAQLSLENQPTGTYIAKIELDTPDYLKIIKN